jgi:hypothetical protein
MPSERAVTPPVTTHTGPTLPPALASLRSERSRTTAVELVSADLARVEPLPAVLRTAGPRLVATHQDRDSMAFRIGTQTVMATPDEAEAFALRLLASARAALRTPAGALGGGSV